MTFSKLHPIALALTLAIISGISVLGLGLSANMFLNGKPLATMVGSVYFTYNPSILNSLLSALLVFVNALVGGYVAAWVYNLLLKYL